MTQYSGEAALACAVVAQAFNDLFGAAAGSDPSSVKRDRDAAAHFLLDRYGDWARSRAWWCLAGGLDPEYVRERALVYRINEATVGYAD